MFEVVDGTAIPLPGYDIEHQQVSFALAKALDRGPGFVFQSVNVYIPPLHVAEFRNRVPDLVVSKHKPEEAFRVGDPPELAIEILSTRRGNVERTEKMDDYSRAGIPEYWIANPFDRVFEVYSLHVNPAYTGNRTAQEDRCFVF